MERPTKLRAVDLITTDLRGREPAWNPQAGNCVLAGAHGHNLEGMNHVLGTDVGDDRFVDRDVDIVERLDVVFAIRVGRVNAKDVAVRDVFHVLFAEHAVGAGVTDVPGELLAHDIDDGRVLGVGKLIHSLSPNRDGHANEENGLGNDNAQFDVA